MRQYTSDAPFADIGYCCSVNGAGHCFRKLMNRKCALAGPKTIAWRKVMALVTRLRFKCLSVE